MESVNYLYLAPSKLRNCAIGPELIVADVDFFNDINGNCSIKRKIGNGSMEVFIIFFLFYYFY